MTRIGPVAFLMAPLGAAAALALAPPVALAQEASPNIGRQAEYEACMRLAGEDPIKALVSAETWIEAGGDAPAEHCLAVALIGLRRHAEAGEILQGLAEDYTPGREDFRAALLAQAGQAWFLADALERAERAQTAALSLVPGDVDLLVDRSLTLAAGKRYWEAIDDLNDANTLAPGRSDVLVYRASAYRLLESYDLAMEDLRVALSIEPNDPVALLERGNLYRRTGADELARDDWTRVIALAPGSEAAGAAHANLRRLESEAEPKTE